MRPIPTIIIGLAFVYFFIRLLKGMQTDNEDERKNTRHVILYGIFALFVLVTLWGIVNIVRDAFFPGAFIRDLGA